jgi:beta-ribofuranosylaminobenzene 5'-phosphate synthase
MIQVVTPSRLHITLIDLNGALGRIDGGVGLTLDYPSIRINAKKDTQLSVSGTTEFAERIRSAASAVLTQYNINGVAIDVVQEYPNHVGLGSGTQVALAVGTAISEL